MSRDQPAVKPDPAPDPTSAGRVWEVALLFLRLGFTAFGGPAAHLALIEDEVVRRRRWIDRQQFLDIVAAVNFIPGPNSTELAIHLGLIRAGWRGLIAAGVCFITPAMLIILPLGWIYVHWGGTPAMTGPLMGIRAAIIAVIAAAMWRFARTGIRDRFTAVVAAAALAAGFLFSTERFRVPQAELVILGTAALAGAVWYARGTPPMPGPKLPAVPLLVPGGALAAGGAAAAAWPSLLKLCLFFLKVGATLFGSGYVLVSYLQGGLVADYKWLTPKQLTDAVAVGQITPGPLLTTATFIGYILGWRWGGPGMAVAGAVLATAAIFLPSFVFVAALGRFWARLRSNPYARGALDGMNAAVVSLILVVAVGLARDAVHTPTAAAITGVTLLAMLLWNVNSTWLIAGAAVMGWAAGHWT